MVRRRSARGVPRHGLPTAAALALLGIAATFCTPAVSQILPASTSRAVAAAHRAQASGGEASCAGRRVFILDPGSQFNRDLLYGNEDGSIGRGTGLSGGFGAEKRSSERPRDPVQMLRGVSTSAGEDHYRDHYREGEGGNSSLAETERWPQLQGTWYDTWANALDVIFHSRMVNYPCLARTEEEADLVYLVYYGSLDISRHLGKNSLQRGRLGREMAQMLSQQPRFQRNKGKDYFVVIGRPLWDFISNISDPYNPWGTDLFEIPSMKSVKVVTVEASKWKTESIGAPYATSFHPPSLQELKKWRGFVESHDRPYLFAFGGAVRRGARQASIARAGVIRERLFWQCAHSEKCRLLDCENPPRACERDWRVFTQLYLSSDFCLHPPGDSCTRRAVLDSMLAGCIPVLLETCTVEEQYQWLLGSPDNFSVYISGETLKSPPEADSQAGAEVGLGKGEVMLEQVLAAIPRERIQKMRKLVLDFIPLITFGGKSNSEGNITPPDFTDAFDYVVAHLSQTVKDALAEK